MAVVKIASNPPSASMSAQYYWNDNNAVVSSSSQIVTFDLTPLGASPLITDVELEIDSTNNVDDKITISFNRVSFNGSPASPNSGLTAYKKQQMINWLSAAARDGTDASMTIKYFGKAPLPGYSVRMTSTVAVRLVITIVGEGGTSDERSQGELSATTVEFGGSISMTITPRNPVCTHQVTYKLGIHTATNTIAAGSTTDSFTLPLVWMDALPSSTTGTMEITLDTLNNGTSVGTQKYAIRVIVPDSIVPVAGTLTAEAANYGALSGDARFFVGASRASLTLTGAAAGQGSSIASVTYSGWGDSVTTQNYQYLTDAIQISGTVTIQALVTDGRGRTAETSVSVVVYNYEQPFFSGIDVTRCDASGVPDDEGTAVIINAVFGCSTTAIQDNTATATVAFLASGSSTWSREFALTNNEDVLITSYPLSASVSYQMRFTVTDHAMSVVLYMSVPSAKYILHFSNNGASIGVGQAAENLESGEMGRFAVNPDWTVKFGTNILIGQQTLAEYIQSIVSSM